VTVPELQVAGLAKSYGSHRAVLDANLEVHSGEIVSLLGPSGCGKTTILRCVAGLEQPDHGEISVDGRSLYSSQKGINLRPEQRGLGLVFQSYAIWPHMTVFDNVAYGLRLRKSSRRNKSEIRKQVDEVLEVVGLSSHRDRFPGMLSGGQQQRVAVARSLVVEPSVLLLDEPMSNLDATVRDQMREYLRSLIKRLGVTAILVTHDHNEALVVSDRVCVMSNGVIAEVGAPEDIYRHPRTLQGAHAVGFANVIPISGVLAAGEDGTRLRVTDTNSVLMVAAGKRGDPVERCEAVIVRPESVRLAEPDAAARAASAENRFAATVMSVFFAGGVRRYDIQWAGGRLRVETSAREQFQTGDSVDVLLPADELIVIAPADASAASGEQLAPEDAAGSLSAAR
jgi:iron(III) transport system ATP-binding protein